MLWKSSQVTPSRKLPVANLMGYALTVSPTLTMLVGCLSIEGENDEWAEGIRDATANMYHLTAALSQVQSHKQYSLAYFIAVRSQFLSRQLSHPHLPLPRLLRALHRPNLRRRQRQKRRMTNSEHRLVRQGVDKGAA